MKRVRFVHLFLITSVAVASSVAGCVSADGSPDQTGSGGGTQSGSGGAPGTGGASTGSGGSGSGGKVPDGSGGSSSGGSSSGGSSSGGSSSGGSGSGGSTTGSGGASGGGAGGGGGRTTGGGGRGGGMGGRPGGVGGGSASSGGSMGGGGAGMPSLSAGCGKAPTIPASMYNNGNPIPITSSGKQRRYVLSVPTGYDNTKPYRLVIAWHQLDGNDKQMYSQNFYWLKDIADAASSTIFVAPNGEKGGAPCTGTGIAEGGCGWPDSNGTNVVLGDDVVAQVEENFCIDKNKIFANGWSYGGSMSFRTACSRPLGGNMGTFGVRAVAIYNGAENLSSGGCKASKPVAFYASHGTNDGVLSYDGGISMANTYAKLNGCTWATPAKASGNHICTQVMGCQAGYPVEFCSFVGPHTPDPPKDSGMNTRWQPAEVWKLFSSF